VAAYTRAAGSPAKRHRVATLAFPTVSRRLPCVRFDMYTRGVARRWYHTTRERRTRGWVVVVVMRMMVVVRRRRMGSVGDYFWFRRTWHTGAVFDRGCMGRRS